MRCSEVEPLLPRYADGDLPPARQERVREHLVACPACRSEAGRLTAALAALRAAGRTGAPDLWTPFRARLGETLSCAAARERLLGEVPESLKVRAHLSACPPCAAEAAAARQALAALERAGRAAPAPDLWPAFQTRLSRASARPRLADRLRALLAPLRQPGAGYAAAALAVLALLPPLLPSRPAPQAVLRSGPSTALQAPIRAGRPVMARIASGAPARSVPPPARRVSYRPAPRRSRHGVPPPVAASLGPDTRSAAAASALESVAAAGRSAVMGRSWASRLQVAYHQPEEPEAGARWELNSVAAQRDLMPEVMQAVELLAGIQEAATSPFGGESGGE